MVSTLINDKQNFAIFSAKFLSSSMRVIFRCFGGGPRIYISFIFCRQPLDILETLWTLLFSSYKR
jgi:hypothetical protein